MDFGFVALVVLGIVFLFFVLREFFCWYFKINETLSILTQIRDELRRQNKASPDGTPVVTEEPRGGLAGAGDQLKSLFGGSK